VTPALTITATVEEGKDYTLAAIGGAKGWPLEIYPLVNDSKPFTDSGKIRITHLAPFAATSDGTKVDICTDVDAVVPGLAGIPYKASTGYLPLPEGRYDLTISVAGSSCALDALDIPPFDLRNGQVADVFAIGLLPPSNLPLQVAQDGLTARIAVAHLAPFASDPISTSVSVKLAGSDVITDFVFGEITDYIPVAPGSYPVEVIPSGTSTPAISGTAAVTAFVDFTFAAIGNGSLQQLELIRLEDDNVTVPLSGTARLRVTHVAPFAGSTAASVTDDTSVDLCVLGSTVPVVSDLVYKEFVSLTLPVGNYSVFVAVAGTACAQRLFGIAPFLASDGDIGYIYAVGDGVNIPPYALANPALTTAPTKYLPLVISQEKLPNIVELAAGDDRFDTLVAALQAAELDGALAGPGPFTVFAPTDDAFAKLPADVLNSLLADPKGDLTQILLYHVVSGSVPSSALSTGLKATTLQGSEVEFTVSGTSVKVNSSNVILADVIASNGIIHVIDTVLIPPAN
jgi:uncharacterized surface protein with fasciclin (FAS1) repeats